MMSGFLNLWIGDLPFKFDPLLGLARYLLPGHFQTSFSDKSGHRHVLPHSSSHTYFGLDWDGVYLVFCTLPFGWKASASPSRVLAEAVNLLVLVNRNGFLQQWFVFLRPI